MESAILKQKNEDVKEIFKITRAIRAYPRDIMDLEKCSYRNVCRIMREIKAYYKIHVKRPLTIYHLSAYYAVSITNILRHISDN
ncbi:hypothetical protein [Flexithrix dorotheae]|uniref:hypothetical protein n=1 Tax=Flexithrix dorotheae TaxID=70993 RepID=UPI00037DCE6D|nr:hypothetical protein [Flexithrix dorotheae]